MARKTFGPNGRSVEIVEDGDREPVINASVVEPGSEVGSVAGDGRQSEHADTISNDAGEVDSVGKQTEYVSPADAATGRKRRGRRSNAEIAADNATAGTGTTADAAKVYREAAKRRKATFALSSNLEKVLLNLHLMGSALLSEPELQIDEDEAKLLANALTEVAEAYEWKSVLSAKTQATIDLSIALATVYGKRSYTIWKKHTSPRRKPPVSVPVPFPAPAVQSQPGQVQ